jgi:penicillin-binding protein 2B
MKASTINQNIKRIRRTVTILAAIVLANVLIVTVFSFHVLSLTNFRYAVTSSKYITKVKIAKRGYIYDRNGNVFAQDNMAYNIIAVLDPKRASNENEVAYVDDKVGTAQKLAPILHEDEAYLLELLSQDTYQTELGAKGRGLSIEQKTAIEELNLNGIEFELTTSRYYPQGNMLANLIGYSLYDQENKALSGKMGIELLYNNELKGKNGELRYQQDAKENVLPGSEILLSEPVNGDNIYLTIDKNIQESLDHCLEGIAQEFDSDESWGAVMEVKTGKILAWSQYPSFDLNKLNAKNYYNMGIDIPYEVGSTMKPITYAAAYDYKNFDIENKFDSGPFYVGFKNNHIVRLSSKTGSIATINNWSHRDWGMISLSQGLSYSANTGIATLLADYLPADEFEKYLKEFGLFQSVGTDRFDDAPGTKVMDYPSEQITTGYGQGSTMTMLQLLQAYSAVMNNGKMVKPYFIDKITDSATGKVLQQGKTQVVGQPISAKAAQTVVEIMRRVANVGPSPAMGFRIPETTIIAKTGTAQIPVNGVYGHRVIASMVIGFPAEDPEVIVYYAFKANDSGSLHYRPQYLQSVMRTTYGNLELYKEQPNNQTESPQLVFSGTMPGLVNHTVSFARSKVQQLKLVPTVIGDGDEVIKQFPQMDEIVYSNKRVFLLTGYHGVKMPNMTGWSRKEVLIFATLLGNDNFKIEGDGLVYDQNIASGESIDQQSDIKVSLK